MKPTAVKYSSSEEMAITTDCEVAVQPAVAILEEWNESSDCWLPLGARTGLDYITNCSQPVRRAREVFDYAQANY